MNHKLDRLALANTFGVIDIVLHPLFHVWVSIAPESYERIMNLFVAGLHLEVTDFDADPIHIIIGTIIEASIFWLLGYCGATVYNYFSSLRKK